jgi:phosphopantothenoylcysteine synthetase/decarboxylase
VSDGKLARRDGLTIECEPTEDVLAAASKVKSAKQRTVGFSLEVSGDIERARQKLLAKHLDLIVFNPAETMNSSEVHATLLWPDGRLKSFPRGSKQQFAQALLDQCHRLFLV